MKEPLRVEARGRTAAPAELVWTMVADAEQYADWGPWDASGYSASGADQAGGVGAVRWMKLGRTRTVERIVEREPDRHLAYTVVEGIPVRNYRADVVLTASGGGTDISWAATWDNTFLGRIVHRRLSVFYPTMVEDLIAAASRRAAAGMDG